MNQKKDELNQLNDVQIKGYYDYGLNIEQVKDENFEIHTLLGMDYFKKEYPSMTNLAIYPEVEGLNAIQIIGRIGYGRTKKQVQAKNFGRHTILAMRVLKQRNFDTDNEEAFSRVEDYNEAQAIGVSEFKLTEKQVEGPNYGMHTIIAIKDIMKQGRAGNYQDAFAMVAGCNKREAGWVSNLGYTQKQVEQRRKKEPENNITNNFREFNQPQNARKLKHFSSMNSIGYDDFPREANKPDENKNPRKLSKGVSV